MVESALALAHESATLLNTVPSSMQMLVDSGGVPETATDRDISREKPCDGNWWIESSGRRRLKQSTASTDHRSRRRIRHGLSMRRAAGFIPTIGRPIANTRVYILDAYGEPAPVGVAGELYIGGAGVARGYLNRAELTAERFVKDPFASEPEARMYKTGDLGRWLPDGNIEFLGRNDFQVKIRGFRIELGEIESRLRECAGVREAVVLAREDGAGDKRLVAYYTTARAGESEQETWSAEALRNHLAGRLPEYMVPAAYVRLESLPLTPNGKLDRKALPAPEAEAYASRGYAPPQGEIETKLAAMWAEVLKLDRVGRHDNFFSLGGHSLLAVRVVSRLRQELGMEVAIRDLFAHPVLADLAKALGSAARIELPPITPAQRSGRLPLSFAQQRLWFLAQMEGVGEAYHISGGVRLKGDLDRAALRRALDRILIRHEALRTTFAFLDGEPVQRIAAIENSRFALLEHELREHRAAQAELDRLMGMEASAPFDLEHGPLIRGRLIRLADDEHALLLTMHHIVSDGWSMGVLINELSALYNAFLRGEDDPLPELDIQYADYAVWQRQWIEGEVLQQQAAYWKTALADVPALLELPTRSLSSGAAGLCRSLRRSGAGGRVDGGSQGTKPATRRHPVHDLVGNMGNAAGEAFRPAGCGNWHPIGQPRTCRDRASDRFLRQHAGRASGSVRLAQCE